MATRRGEPDVALLRFGTRVRDSRKHLGLSQAEVAAKAGISQSNWSKIERAEIDPSLTQILRIQKALGAPSIEGLFGSFPSAEVLAGR